MRFVVLLQISLFSFFSLCVGESKGDDLNRLIVETIKEMPSAGGYARYQRDLPENQRFLQLYETVDDLQSAIRVGIGGKLKVNAGAAGAPSFCSSATYLLFCAVLEKLQEDGRMPVDRALNQEIADVGATRSVIHGKLDGVGIFGHWNANGPGTGVLFSRLDLGSNFSSFERAKPGDFLKIFWNEAIGKGERGHLVVYLGENERGDAIEVWSSNMSNEDGSGGYGSMWVEKDRIKRALFSRFERPKNLLRWLEFSEKEKTSDYLVAILSKGSTGEEMKKVTRSED